MKGLVVNGRDGDRDLAVELVNTGDPVFMMASEAVVPILFLFGFLVSPRNPQMSEKIRRDFPRYGRFFIGKMRLANQEKYRFFKNPMILTIFCLT